MVLPLEVGRGDREQRLRRRGAASQHQLCGGALPGRRAQRAELVAGVGEPPGAHQRQAARVVPDPVEIAVPRVGPRRPQDGVPAPEARQGERRDRHELLHEVELVDEVRGGGLELPARRDSELAAALDAGGGPQEVDVVRVVGRPVEGASAAPREEGLVGGGGAPVDLQRVVVATHPPVDVGRHVHEVAGLEVEGAETIGGRLALLREELLGGVDVVVVGADVLGPRRQRELEQPQHLAGVLPRLALRGPVVPGREVHQGLGGEGGDVDVVGMIALHPLHGLGVGAVERGSMVGGIRGVAGGEGGDQRALLGARSGLEPSGALHGGMGLPARLRTHGRVDVRSQGERLAPGAGRAVGIHAGGGPEGANRGVVVEAVGEREALVEVALGQGRRRRDREMRVSELPDQAGGVLSRLRRRGLRPAATAEGLRQGHQDDDREPGRLGCGHEAAPPPGAPAGGHPDCPTTAGSGHLRSRRDP